ncbi:MAG: hypothetical protein AAB731_01705, partial [Patescibacteria group bacterium]
MKRLATLIVLCLSPPAFAEPPASQPIEKESSLKEKITGKEKIVIPSNLRLEIGYEYFTANSPSWGIGRHSPFARIDYRLLDFIYLYAVIGTEATSFYYLIQGNSFSLKPHIASRGNIVDGYGFRLVFWQNRRVRLEGNGYFESLNETQVKINKITINLSGFDLDITEALKDHAIIDYKMKKIAGSAKLQFTFGRFKPYIVGGWSWLALNFKIQTDSYTGAVIKFLTRENINDYLKPRYNYSRGLPTGFLGVEIRITKKIGL